MATLVPVDDPTDDRLADYLHLSDAQLRRYDEVFLCEGVLVIRRALELGTPLRSMLLTPGRVEHLRADLDAFDGPVYVVSQDVMAATTGFNIHRGALAAARRPSEPPLTELLTGRTIAVLEGVNDHENLGGLFRSAAAFGVDAVLLDPRTADPLYRRSVRVSLGHVLAVPFARVDDLREVRAAGFEVVALTPDRSAEPIDVLDHDGKVALLLGAEGPGLTDDALATADRRVRIPMVGGVDSLNVSVAAAVAFHRRYREA